MNFRHAIVRLPAPNFAEGLTTAELGPPDYTSALAQHGGYCAALQACGLELIVLPPDPAHPDSTFVEDTAIVTRLGAILANPGAASRKGEVAGVRAALAPFFERFEVIKPPGALDGGDVCEADGHFFIGISERTNAAGARQLADFLAGMGYTSNCIQVTGLPGLLHLKSGLAYLGEGRLVCVEAFLEQENFRGYQVVRVDPQETYAANSINVNGQVLIPEGFPRLRGEIEALGYPTLPLEMSEFQKMDGGLSCLSLRLE